MSKYVIGVTGGIATGKTNVTDALQKAGAFVVDADVISRQLTGDNGPALESIRRVFGEQAVQTAADGVMRLDRKALGSIVFEDACAREKLNAILHPMIIAECADRIRLSEGKLVFLSAPLLYECGMDKMCDEVWCTLIDEETQLARLCARDQSTQDAARARISSQLPAREKARRADHVIDTSGSREQSAAKALALYRARLSAHETH